MASRTLPEKLRFVLNSTVKIINYIRKNSLNHRIFKKLCEEYESEHTVLLYHTDVRWLSRGKVVTRFFELWNEVNLFLENKNKSLLQLVRFEGFYQLLAYLSDIFRHLNNISISLQGRKMNILKSCEIILAFKDKLIL